MTIKIIFFASLADFTGKQEMELENCSSVSQLNEILNEKFAGFSNQKFAIAVNKLIVNDNLVFSDGDIVALLPPFSGG
ncbi:MAG TPA: MoaD/ThiS family protein [Bacteroidia bacterium]|nr:MoaD/ThiS family protein [Bacteroidia bacterium]